MSSIEVMSSRNDLTALLGQAGWTKRLARSLAGDVDLAEDLVQDAWVAALERPPDLGRPVRGWFGTVLRHRWLDLLRSRERRLDRERGAAASEAWPSSHDVVEKAALQRELVEAVLELDEPYRTTVLLRFFEELPQREIARRMQTSTATVNSRLQRALARLRERMSRGGGRTAWLQVLVPLLREPVAPAVALGAGVMKTVLLSVLVVASVVAGIALWSSGDEVPLAAAPAPVPVEAAPVAPAERSSAPAAAETSREQAGQRSPVAVVSPPSAERASAPAPRTVRGHVLDSSGRAVSGIALALAAKDSKATSTSDGRGEFEIALDAPAESIVAADPAIATVLAGSARVHDSTRTIVVIAARIDLAGVVLDESGALLADAALELRLPEGFGSEWGVALDYSLPQRWRARSGADGRFELPAVPAVDGALIHAALAGFAPLAAESPLRSTSALELVLARPSESSGLVHGVVLDPRGTRAEGARVSAGSEIALTDARGEFTLDVRLEGTRARLVALAPGLLPGVFEPERGPGGELLWPAEVVLQLGAPAGTLTGRVVDADGEPMSGVKVWLDDTTSFGRSVDGLRAVESLLGGGERFWSFVRTAADGTFALEGLLERDYRLQAVDPRTLASVESGRVSAADSPVELRLPTRDVHERVAGRVVTSAGAPIPGVTMRLFRITYEVEHENGTDNEVEEGEPVVTGEDGAFEFRNVPRHGVDLIATGDTILGASAELEQESDPTSIEIVASLRLHLQVELDEGDAGIDGLRVFDAEGQRVILMEFHGRSSYASFDKPILDGRSAVLAVEERAATVVLYRGAEEVARLPLRLVPGRTNVVRF